jgi:type II secretory pathway component PulK
VSKRRRGAALLEALVALALLGSIGSAAAWSATEWLHGVERMRARERDQLAAARLLTAISLWPRDDLDRHLGERRQGPWRVRIDRPAVTIYAVTIADSTSGMTILKTALYREEMR